LYTIYSANSFGHNKPQYFIWRGILPNHTDFNCYVDASHASDVDTRRSITGYIFFISGGPVSWQSRMQTSVALSSIEAEYMVASAATQEAMWQARLLEQIGMRIDLPIKLYEDNKFSYNVYGSSWRSPHYQTY
jgi:hypothetical protein